jgi:hypothetical protein
MLVFGGSGLQGGKCNAGCARITFMVNRIINKQKYKASVKQIGFKEKI